jgi:hypothetical protein
MTTIGFIITALTFSLIGIGVGWSAKKCSTTSLKAVSNAKGKIIGFFITIENKKYYMDWNDLKRCRVGSTFIKPLENLTK